MRHLKRLKNKARQLKVRIVPDADEAAHPFEVRNAEGRAYTGFVASDFSLFAINHPWGVYHPDEIDAYRMAVARELFRRQGYRASFWLDEAAADRQHRRKVQVLDAWATLRPMPTD